jgi:hypothetical protein
MSLMGQRYDELRAQEARKWDIRRRIEHRYARLKSFSPAMRKHFAERDIRAALVEAGLPLPRESSFEERVQRYVAFARRDRKLLKGLDPKLRAAVLAEIDRQAVTI